MGSNEILRPGGSFSSGWIWYLCQISVVLYWKHVLLLDSWNKSHVELKEMLSKCIWSPTADFNIALVYAGNSHKVCKRLWLISNMSPEHILTEACIDFSHFILSFFKFRQWTWHGPGMWINADVHLCGFHRLLSPNQRQEKMNLLISEENWYLLSDDQRKI